MCLLEFDSSSFEKCIESCNQYKNYRKVLSAPQIVPLFLVTNPSGKCQPKTSTNLFSVTYAFCLYRIAGVPFLASRRIQESGKGCVDSGRVQR